MVKNSCAFSIIEIIVVVGIFGMLAAVTLPRMGEIFGNDSLKKDVQTFISNVHEAQSIVNSGTSQGCPSQQRVKQVNIQNVAANRYSVITTCTVVVPDPLFTPVPLTTRNVSVESTTSISGPLFFAAFYPNSEVTITPGVTIAFTQGTKTCTVTLSSAGVIGTTGTCP